MSGPDDRSRAGSPFGHYQLRRLITRTGMAELYEAEDTSQNRTVALKLFPAASGDPGLRARVQQQAKSVAQLTEPHVAQIHGCGEIDGVLYIDMQLIDGTDLATILKRYGPLNPARAVAIIRQVASALDAAHASGLLHRDVTPEDILITGDDFAYLVDFGVAGAASEERFTSGTFDYHADIYSLACVLYECLTGATPLTQPIPRPSAQRAGIPEAFDEVISHGMAKKPEDRYSSAGDLARAAENALAPSDYGAAEDFDGTAGAAPREHATGDMLTPTVEVPVPQTPPGLAPSEHATGEMLMPTVADTPLPPTTALGSAATPAATAEPVPTHQAQPGEQALPIHDDVQFTVAAINAPDELSPKQQLAIVVELRHALRRQTDDKGRDDIRRLLRALRRRPEATYAAVVEIDDILAADTRPSAARGPTPSEAPTTTYRREPTEAPTAIVRMPVPWPRGAPPPTTGPAWPQQRPIHPPSWPPPPPGIGAGPPTYQPQSARGRAGMWVVIAAIALILVGIAVVVVVALS
jgi:Protein kinase domain